MCWNTDEQRVVTDTDERADTTADEGATWTHKCVLIPTLPLLLPFRNLLFSHFFSLPHRYLGNMPAIRRTQTKAPKSTKAKPYSKATKDIDSKPATGTSKPSTKPAAENGTYDRIQMFTDIIRVSAPPSLSSHPLSPPSADPRARSQTGPRSQQK